MRTFSVAVKKKVKIPCESRQIQPFLSPILHQPKTEQNLIRPIFLL